MSQILQPAERVESDRGVETNRVDELDWGVNKPWGVGVEGGGREQEESGRLRETGLQEKKGRHGEERGGMPKKRGGSHIQWWNRKGCKI